MVVTLKESSALRQMAGLMYDFLPGSGSRAWKNHVSFASVARDVGVAEFWPGGSKEPAIGELLERTFERKPALFEPLILRVVRGAMRYRQNRRDPLKRKEVEALNELLAEVSFKFPDLWDEGFLDSLAGESLADVATAPSSILNEVELQPKISSLQLAELREHFYELSSCSDRNAAGYELERLLDDLFGLFGLDPRKPFKVTGEQIDGSFQLDFETYLLEARWRKDKIPEADLLVFRGKIEGKSAHTRGVFLAVNGFSDAAVDAISKGKQPLFFLMDGYDLSSVLEGQVELPHLLRYKQRRMAEEGATYVHHSKESDN